MEDLKQSTHSFDHHRFHVDLTAAIMVGAPISFQSPFQSKADRAGDQVRILADLKRWETALTAQLSRADRDPSATIYQQLVDAFAQSSVDFSSRYRAALTTFAVTNSMLPVLNGLTVQAISRRQVSRSLRWPFIYLAIVLSVAWLGLVLFSWELNPLLVELRHDLKLPGSINVPARFDVTPWLPGILIALGTGLIIFVSTMLLGGFSKIVMAMGGRRYVRTRMIATGLQTTQALVEHGVPRSDAAKLSCDLIAADLKIEKDLTTATTQITNREHWTALERYRSTAADQQLNYLKVTIPASIISTVGGIAGLSYAVVIYGPIIALIKDLTTAGT